MRVYSYIVKHDYGFAPNPFHGVCTLATCKPAIRRNARVGDWVVGTGAVRTPASGKLVYAMQVSGALTFDQYWNDSRFKVKRPVLNGSLKLLYGDNIYHRDDHKRWLQADSHHSRPNGVRHIPNLTRDVSADRVLLADRFCYFGGEGLEIPARFRSRLCIGRVGHGVYDGKFALSAANWLDGLPQGIVHFPLEHAKHPKPYDVFLCHNGHDKVLVRQIYRGLRRRGVVPWFDEEHLRPGTSWQRELENVISSISSAAVLIGGNGTGPWQSFEMEAFLREFHERGCPVIPVFMRTSEGIPELPLFLRSFSVVDFRQQTPDPWRQLLWGITGSKAKLK